MGRHSRPRSIQEKSKPTLVLLASLSAGATVVFAMQLPLMTAPEELPLSSANAFQVTSTPATTTPSQTNLVVPTPTDPTPVLVEPQGPVEKDAGSPLPSTGTSTARSTVESSPVTTEPPPDTPEPTVTTTAPPRPVTTSQSKCSNIGVVDSVLSACNSILSNVSGVTSVGGRAGRTGASCHPSGLALDLMSSREVGDAVADYVLNNMDSLGVSSVIWRQRINLGSGWEPMSDRGGITANHFDHVHVSFLPCRN